VNKVKGTEITFIKQSSLCHDFKAKQVTTKSRQGKSVTGQTMKQVYTTPQHKNL